MDKGVDFRSIADPVTLSEIASYVNPRWMIDFVIAKLEIVLEYHYDDELDNLYEELVSLRRSMENFDRKTIDWFSRDIDLDTIHELIDLDGLVSDIYKELECTGDKVNIPAS